MKQHLMMNSQAHQDLSTIKHFPVQTRSRDKPKVRFFVRISAVYNFHDINLISFCLDRPPANKNQLNLGYEEEDDNDELPSFRGGNTNSRARTLAQQRELQMKKRQANGLTGSGKLCYVVCILFYSQYFIFDFLCTLCFILCDRYGSKFVRNCYQQ